MDIYTTLRYSVIPFGNTFVNIQVLLHKINNLFIFPFSFVSKHQLWKSKLYIWTHLLCVCVCEREKDREREREGGGGKRGEERDNFFYFTGSLRIMVFERGSEDIYV